VRPPGQTGRPRLKGNRLPTLQPVLLDATTPWTAVTISGWYQELQRTVEIASATAVWYHTGRPPVPLRWVLIRDPQNKFRPQALLATELRLSSAQRLSGNSSWRKSRIVG